MSDSLWISTSGAMSKADLLDSVANNLANVDTLGFKKDVPTFKEYMTLNERMPEGQEIPRGPIKDKELYPLDSRDKSWVVTSGTHTLFKQGNLKVTQRSLDVALEGDGFLEVATPQGIRFTRLGNMKITSDGVLATNDGYPVLSNAGGDPGEGNTAGTNTGPNTSTNTSNDIGQFAGRFINIGETKAVPSISETGEIFLGDQTIGQLKVTEFINNSGLRKQGSQLFYNTTPNNIKTETTTKVRQGMLETSNVNPVEEMTNLIKANRLFEQDLKAMKTVSELMGREANDVGKL